MAEVTAMRNNALPYPVYGVAFTVVAPLLDADGDPISPSSPDSEVSKNGDTFADCTNEATEIATSSGVVYLTLTATEMTADIVTVRIQSTGAKTTILTLYPRKLPILSTGTCQGSNDTGDIQLASGDSAIDDTYNGCLCVAVIDGTTEARIINDYVGSTKVGEVSPAWNTAQPDSNDTYTIYLPEGRQVQAADVKAYGGTAGTFSSGRPEVNTTHVGGTSQTARDIGASVLLSSGTGTGQVKLSSGYVAPNWGDVGNPTTTLNLSGTTVKTLTDAPADSSGTTTLLSRLSSTRAGYLDNLSAGAVALQSTLLTVAGYVDTEIGAIQTQLTAMAGAGFDTDTDSLEALRNRGDTAWTTATGFSTLTQADIRTAVGLATNNLDTQLAALSTAIDATPTNAELNARTLLAAEYATAANLATLAGYVDTEVAAIKAKTDNLPSDPADASDIASSFTTVNTKLDTIDDFLDTEVAAIKARTDNLPADPADASDIAASFSSVLAAIAALQAFVDTEIAAILEDTGTTLPAQIAALNNLSAAEVRTQVVAALVTDTYAEPSAVPAATASLKEKLGWLFMLARNRMTQTAALQAVRNDADSANVGTAAVSDDGTTAERSEWS